MNEFLQIIGSVASIGSVPLAIYLYLKSQVIRHLNIRRDIVNRLSFQIGEGRNLSIFEIQSVIESKARENRIRNSLIQPDEIIEDLVTETIVSPLLESSRKEKIIGSLRELHTLAKLFYFVSIENNVIGEFQQYLKDTQNGATIASIEDRMLSDTLKKTEDKKARTPEIFGLISAMIGFVALIATIVDFTAAGKILPKLLNSELLTSFVLGIGTSTIAAMITIFISKKAKKT